MKRLCNIIVFITLLFCITIDVNATEYNKNALIPVNTTATVHTDKFDYNNFMYNNNVNDKGNAIMTFQGIQNNTLSKTAVSIDVLLFDSEKKNIGFLTYCTDKDVSSDYAGFKLHANQSAYFSINVTTRYLVDGKLPKDVRFIAVKDENKYCQIGGYSKYSGLTIEQINDGEVIEEVEESQFPSFDFSFLSSGILVIVVAIVIAIGIFAFVGFVLNTLHKRMYEDGTILAFLPVTNFYIEMKLCFGKLIAKAAIIVYFIAIGLSAINVMFLSYIISFISIVGFILVIVKLITKNYSLLYYERSADSDLKGELKKEDEKAIDLSYDDDIANKPLNLDGSNMVSSGANDKVNEIPGNEEVENPSSVGEVYDSESDSNNDNLISSNTDDLINNNNINTETDDELNLNSVQELYNSIDRNANSDDETGSNYNLDDLYATLNVPSSAAIDMDIGKDNTPDVSFNGFVNSTDGLEQNTEEDMYNSNNVIIPSESMDDTMPISTVSVDNMSDSKPISTESIDDLYNDINVDDDGEMPMINSNDNKTNKGEISIDDLYNDINVDDDE